MSGVRTFNNIAVHTPYDSKTLGLNREGIASSDEVRTLKDKAAADGTFTTADAAKVMDELRAGGKAIGLKDAQDLAKSATGPDIAKFRTVVEHAENLSRQFTAHPWAMNVPGDEFHDS